MHARRRALALAAIAALFMTGCAGTAVSSSGGGAGADGAAGPEALVSVPGFDAETKTITVGNLVPTSGVFAPAVTNVTGQEAWFHRATQPGGPLEGFTVEVENYDTEYNPSVAVPLYNSMKNDVLMLTNVLGTAIVQALLPQLETDNMMAIPAVAVEDLLQHPNIAPFGPVYATYHSAAIQYFADEQGLQDATYCALLQDDDFGDQVEHGFDYAVEELGLKKGVAVRFPTAHQDFTPQISRLKSAGCEVVDLGGAGAVIQNAAVRAVQLNFDAKWIAGNTAYNESLATGPAADYIKENVKFFVTGTEWGDTSVEGQKMLEEDLAEIDPDHKPMANSYQTGYLSGMVATAILEQAIADGDMSREHLMEIAKTLDTVPDYGLGGGDYTYGGDPAKRKSGHFISVFTVNEDAATGLKLEEYNYDSAVAKEFNATEVGK